MTDDPYPKVHLVYYIGNGSFVIESFWTELSDARERAKELNDAGNKMRGYRTTRVEWIVKSRLLNTPNQTT